MTRCRALAVAQPFSLMVGLSHDVRGGMLFVDTPARQRASTLFADDVDELKDNDVAEVKLSKAVAVVSASRDVAVEP